MTVFSDLKQKNVYPSTVAKKVLTVLMDAFHQFYHYSAILVKLI